MKRQPKELERTKRGRETEERCVHEAPRKRSPRADRGARRSELAIANSQSEREGERVGQWRARKEGGRGI